MTGQQLSPGDKILVAAVQTDGEWHKVGFPSADIVDVFAVSNHVIEVAFVYRETQQGSCSLRALRRGDRLDASRGGVVHRGSVTLPSGVEFDLVAASS